MLTIGAEKQFGTVQTNIPWLLVGLDKMFSDYQKGGSTDLVLGHAPVHGSKQKDDMCVDFRTSEAKNHMVQEAGKTLVNGRETKKAFPAAVLETDSWSHAREGRNVFIV